MVTREPIGVVGGIGAWNFPMQTCVWKVSILSKKIIIILFFIIFFNLSRILPIFYRSEDTTLYLALDCC